MIYLPLLRRLNPRAQILYLASDSLDAIGQAETIKCAFRAHAHLVDSARLPSPYLVSDIPASIPCYYIPHGIQTDRFSAIGPSPYRPGTRNAVSVGSMLFDPEFFRIAGANFPDVTFHVIGSGYAGEGMRNVIYYPEMPFETTLPFIKHSNFAIAPYGMGVEPYLTHTSMKLMQYGYLGVPAVCPEVVAGGVPGRFGYRHDAVETIKGAIASALACGPLRPRCVLEWREVVQRLINPLSYADTRLAT